MAKMRTASQPVKWQDGLVLPETAAHMERYNENQARGLYGPSSVSPRWEPEDLSTAIVHHGEKLHALQVNHEKGIIDNPYLWSIHEHDGHGDPKMGGWEHLDPGDRDVECPMCEAAPGEKCAPDCWDQSSHTGGPLGTNPFESEEQWQDGTRGELWGWQPDRESAQRAAETAWAKYVGEQRARRDEALSGHGDVDIDRPARRGDDFDYGDIFGDGGR